jgi:hypothetical protein
MKTSNRVGRNATAAEVPAQTENQVLPGSEQYKRELAAAKQTIAEFYAQARLKKYSLALHDLTAFGCAIQYHPDIQIIVAALQHIGFAEDALDAFNCESKAMAAAGNRSSLTDEERAARQWFSTFYNRIHEKDFLGAQLEYDGFYQWIKPQTEYAEVAAALAEFLTAADVLDKFMDAILHNVGIDPTEKGGAR